MYITKLTTREDVDRNIKSTKDIILHYCRMDLIGKSNCHGTVTGVADREYPISDAYDSELEFDSGLIGFKWRCNCDDPFTNPFYSEKYNLT